MKNIAYLEANKYPGRIVFGGTMQNGHIVQGLIINVRSKPNQNRVLVEVARPNFNGQVKAEFANPAEAAGVDPTNILYTAMSDSDRSFVTSNGQHTEVVHSMHHNLAASLIQAGWGYEHDSANTPRIAVYTWIEPDGPVHTEFAVLKKSPFDDTIFGSNFYYRKIQPGFGFYVSTYEYDDNPPPSWVGEPRLIPLIGTSLAQVTANLWDTMNRDYRVAIAAKEIAPETLQSRIHIVNAREIVTAQP